MPLVTVPLSRSSSPSRRPRSAPSVSVSYRVLGEGPVLVLMVPGMCVPASMYDSMAAVLAATSQFTAVVLDNRGMGLSDAPPASLLGGPGYTAPDLAADAWQVVDAVFKVSRKQQQHATPDRTGIDLPDDDNPADMRRDTGGEQGEQPSQRRRVDTYDDDVPLKWRAPLHPEVALIGHSMGGMVVQAMLDQRPRQVRFAGLLSTHAGGVWNMVPTTRMMKGILTVAWSGFDRDVNAAVNLSLHFTQRFLDAWVVHDLDDDDEQLEGDGEEKEKGAAQQQQDMQDDEEARKEAQNGSSVEDVNMHMIATYSAGSSRAVCGDAERPVEGDSCDEQKHNANSLLCTGVRTAGHGLGYLESKVVDLVRDAQIYFGLTRSFREKLWKPQKTLLEAIAKRRRRARRRRRDIYHAKYTGAEASHPSDVNPANVSDESSSSVLPNPEDSPHTMYGHAAVVRSHFLSRALAAKLKSCTRVVKLVMTGRHDEVVTPSSSRALAASIGANTVVEVEAAHFITDEAAAEVTTHVIYGLRKAFFARNALPCECEWCVEEKPDTETQFPTCRMC